jgi:pyroglutamyl-peptidase
MIVVGAFEPFGGRTHNRAWEAAKQLKGATIAGHDVELVMLPVVFAHLERAVAELFEKRPERLLLVGESHEAHTLLVERIAINVAHARLGDNAGACPVDEEVVPGAEAARRPSFDPRKAAHAAVRAGVPCDVSSHAGTFCCNAAFYHALGRSRTAAFVHVPSRWPWARDARSARGLYAIVEFLTSVPE